MNEFESTVKQLLNQNVDALLGPHRPAPQRDLSADGWGRRGLRPWIAPLVIAACLVAALIATLTGTKVLSNHRAATPISTAPAPRPTVVQLADARIWLPAGWAAQQTGFSLDTSSTWCLGPARGGGTSSPCRVWLERSVYNRYVNRYDLLPGYNSDTPGGTPYIHENACPVSVIGYSVLDAGDRDFGGRTADYREFELECSAGSVQKLDYTQYMVPAGPAFDLYAYSTDSALRATMAQIAQRSTLPKQTTAQRYYDQGYVRSLKSVAGRIQITLDRVIIGPKGPINNDPRTYVYYVPAALWSVSNVHFALGDLAIVETDGTDIAVDVGYGGP